MTLSTASNEEVARKSDKNARSAGFFGIFGKTGHRDGAQAEAEWLNRGFRC